MSTTTPRTITSVVDEPVWGQDLWQFDQLLTLSYNPHVLKSILGRIFYEPNISCNASGAWLQGAITVLKSRPAQDLNILTRTFSLRSPHLSFLWLGAIIAGLHKGFLKDIRGLLGFNRIDIHEAVWTSTSISFVQDHVPQQQQNATSIWRKTEFTLAFLAQGESRYRQPPIYPYPPPGSTANGDLDLEVRLHMACPGGHGLKFSKITWNCAGGKKEVQETAIVTTAARPTHIPGCAALTNPVNYTGLDPDRDISELVTRNIFMWMREMDGFPISERDIYKHGWFGDGDFDDEDSNCAEGDGGSTMDCNLSVTVGGWISGVMTAGYNSS